MVLPRGLSKSGISGLETGNDPNNYSPHTLYLDYLTPVGIQPQVVRLALIPKRVVNFVRTYSMFKHHWTDHGYHFQPNFEGTRAVVQACIMCVLPWFLHGNDS